MLKLLIWKQFYQTFRSYFVDNKTGKAKSKIKIIGMFISFIFVMFSLCAMFYLFATSLFVLLDSEFGWLYYAFFGMLTLGLGVLTSLFNTANTIYNAKDNDLLLSLPIKPKYVLLSRIASIFGLSLVYSATAWLSICVAAFVYKGFNILTCILDVILLFAIVGLACVISCAGGYVVAILSNKTKNKSIVSVVLSLVFLGGYYYLCFRFSDFIDSFIDYAGNFANVVVTWGNIFYQLGKAANGDIISFALFVGVCAILAIACYLILKKNFTTIVTKSNNVAVNESKIAYKSSTKLSDVLLKKELKRFTSSSVYMLNCGIGSIFVIIVAIIFVIKSNDTMPMLEMLQNEIPIIISSIPLAIVGIICSIISINTLTVPSVALEGKNLWLLKSLPINTYEILDAKKRLQLIINGIPSIIAAIIICFTFKLDISTSLYVVVEIFLFVYVQASIGVILSLNNPNFNWTSETQPIKRNINVLFDMIICWILLILMVGGYYFLMNKMYVNDYMQYLTIILAVIEIMLRRFIRSWGVEKFDTL